MTTGSRLNAMETYYGHVRSPQDAIILFEACRMGLLPRVQRRLSEKERQQIRSGSVFVWDEREAGMRRWTDGKSWSASRVSGSFLTYREMEGKRGVNGFPPAVQTKKVNGKDGSKTGDSDEADTDKDGPDGYRYKPDGLMKQSFSITATNGQHLHLISYYSRQSPTSPQLRSPSNDPSLGGIRPQKGMYPDTTVNEAQSVPAVTQGPMPGSPYAQSPHAMMSPYGPPPGAPPPPGYMQQYPGAPWPPSPMSTPPGHYAYYPGAPPSHSSPHGQQPHPYGHPMHYPHHHYNPQQRTQFDRAPPPLHHPQLPPPQPGAPTSNAQGPPMPAAHVPYPAQSHQGTQGVQLSQNPYSGQGSEQRPESQPPALKVDTPHGQPQYPYSGEQVNGDKNHSPSQNGPNGINGGRQTPPTAHSQTAESLAVPESNTSGSGSPTSRTMPSIGNLLDNSRTEESAEGENGRSRSKSPNSAQRGAQDVSLRGQQQQHDKDAIKRLDAHFAKK